MTSRTTGRVVEMASSLLETNLLLRTDHKFDEMVSPLLFPAYPLKVHILISTNPTAEALFYHNPRFLYPLVSVLVKLL